MARRAAKTGKRGRPANAKSTAEAAKLALAKLPPDKPATEPGLTLAEIKALIVNWMPHVERSAALLKRVGSDHRNIFKKIKAELGDFGPDMVKAAIDRQDVEKAVEMFAKIQSLLQVDRMFGGDFAERLKLLDKMPAVQRAFLEGQTACMKGEAAKPPYDPGEMYDSWLNGYHREQENVIRGGITTGGPAHGSTHSSAELAQAQDAREPLLGSERAWTAPEPGRNLQAQGTGPAREGGNGHDWPGSERVEREDPAPVGVLEPA